MEDKPYYMAYESRYQKVFEAGAKWWGHSPDNEDLVSALTEWVDKYQLKGKKVVEFACGEGASGVILSRLGCIYQGFDIAPTAVEKARAELRNFPQARVSLLDMVSQQAGDIYDGSLDSMGFHMLVTDSDRASYLKNANASLKSGAPMLFYRECYRSDAYQGKVETFEEWVKITGSDYTTPDKRIAKYNGREVEVYIPLVPARANTRAGYEHEMKAAGFVTDDFREMDINDQNPYSASIYVRKL